MNLFTTRSKKNITITKTEKKKRPQPDILKRLPPKPLNKSFLPPKPSPLKLDKKLSPEINKRIMLKSEMLSRPKQKQPPP